MFTIVCYDTPSDKRRRRLAKVACSFVTRVQKSVFEGQLDPPHLHQLAERIAQSIDPECDSVRIYQLPADALRDVVIFGRPGLQIREPVYWVGPDPDGADGTVPGGSDS